jgi:Leucine-rich repeat (LRR) protein
MSKPGLRFSIRVLLVIFALLGILLGMHVNRARNQARVAGQLNSGIIYRHQWPPGGRLDRNAEPPGPKWLRDLIGDHYFQTLHIIEGGHPDEKLLADIGRLHGLEQIIIHANRLTDPDALRNIRNCRTLESVSVIYGKKLKRVNLSCLGNLPRLHSLRLDSLKIDDDEIENIAAVKSLRKLTIKQTLITKEGVDRLAVLRPDIAIDYSQRVISPGLFP